MVDHVDEACLGERLYEQAHVSRTDHELDVRLVGWLANRAPHRPRTIGAPGVPRQEQPNGEAVGKQACNGRLAGTMDTRDHGAAQKTSIDL
jgi:hypothetical protein